MVCFIVELHCAAIPEWFVVELNTTDTLVETFVNATCLEEDLTTATGSTSQVVKCGYTGEWEPTLLPCDKKAKKIIPPTESKGAVQTGVITCAICGACGAFVIVTDIPTIVVQLRAASPEIKNFIRHHKFNRMRERKVEQDRQKERKDSHQFYRQVRLPSSPSRLA